MQTALACVAEQSRYNTELPIIQQDTKIRYVYVYICISFDGEFLESALKPAYKNHRRFMGVLIPTGELYRFYLLII
jgi:hypothetical protein